MKRTEHQIFNTKLCQIKPDAPQGVALYDSRGWTLNGWGKYGHNIQAGFSSKFGLWLNSWHSIGFWHRMNVF